MSRALLFDDDGDDDDGGDDGGLSTRLPCVGHERMCARESLTCRRPLPRTSFRIENGWN